MNRHGVSVLVCVLIAMFLSFSALAETGSYCGSAPDKHANSKKHEKKLPKYGFCRDEWGGYGGPMFNYLNIDLSSLHPMDKDRGIGDINGNMILYGGLGGWIYKDFRFGGFGFGGSSDSRGTVSGAKRSAEFSIGGGGVFGEYNYTVNRYLGLLVGGMVGAGGIGLDAEGADLGPTGKWSGSGAFFLGYPYGGVWLSPVKWMWVQLNAGYLFCNTDTSGTGFTNKNTGVHMTHGDIDGGFMAGVQFLFGRNPNRK